GGEDDVGHRFFQVVGIAPPDDARLLHRGVFDQRVLDLHRAYPDATHFQHVIRAAGVPVVAIGISGELVAGADPMAFDGVLCPLVLVPVVGARAVALDHQVADRPDRNILTGLVDDARLVSRHQLAGGARTSSTRPV